MKLTHEQLRGHIQAIREGALGWNTSEDALLLSGKAALALLIEALGQEQPDTEQARRLAETVAAFGSAPGLMPLLQLVQESKQSWAWALFLHTLGAVEETPSLPDIEPLVALLHADLRKDELLRVATLLVSLGKRHPKRVLSALSSPAELLVLFQSARQLDAVATDFLLTQTLDFLEQRATDHDIALLLELLANATRQLTPPERVLVAHTFVKLAERDPRPALRAALPLLRYNLTAPRQFFLLHRRLKAALAHEALPIPASGENKADGLPLPTDGSV